MEYLIAAAVILWITSWIYRSGKRTGSIKGYNAGRRSRRKRRF